MKKLKEKVNICCIGDKNREDDFFKALAVILRINSAGFILNNEKEGLLIFISKIAFFIKHNPTVWESEIKKEFTESLIEMANNPKWGKRVNSQAKEALLELCLANPPILKETKRAVRWFDWEQSSYLKYLLIGQEDYKSQEAYKTLCC